MIDSTLDKEIVIEKIKEFLDGKFSKMNIFQEVESVWKTASIVIISYLLKGRTEKCFVIISVVSKEGIGNNSKITVESKETLTIEYFLLELNKIL